MNRTVLTSFIILCLLSIMLLIGTMHFVQIAKASETIYIKADGSVEGTDKIQRNGDTYIFIDNIFDEVAIEKDDIVIDGAGYTLQGNNIGRGIDLSNRSDVTIRNLQIALFDYGIFLANSSSNIISGDNITNNENGVWIENSTHNIVVRNKIAENYYFGIYLDSHSNYNKITENNISDNDAGIHLHGSSNHNNIVKNNITNNNNGIYPSDSSSNNIVKNNITNNYCGIYLDYSSSYNKIVENDFVINDYGILFSTSSNNSIYHNNFLSNSVQAIDFDSLNIWNDDDNVEGNYWSNYVGTDSNHNGIGDDWYEIDENNTDYYPLMGMFNSFNTSLGYQVNVISNSTIVDFQYFESNSTIRMHVSNSTANQAYGFCRVCISHNLMNAASISVVIDNGETTVFYPNYDIYDNGTHRWIYLAFEHSTHQVDIIPEFPLFIILPVFIMATLLVVTFYKRKHII